MAVFKGLTAKALSYSSVNKLRFCVYLGLLYCGILCLYELKMSSHGLNYTEVDFMKLEDFDNSNGILALSDGAQRHSKLRNTRFKIPRCPAQPRNTMGESNDRNIQNRSWFEIRQRNPDILLGGKFSPRKCIPRYNVAIIIPFRNRDYQLRTVLSHMHPIWQRQDISYQVYVITQTQGALFNRAKLLNIGVSEARKDGHHDCYVFQDVDLLLEDDRCLYWCHELNPRHVSMHLDKYGYAPLTYNAYCSEDSGRNSIFQALFSQFIPRQKIAYFGGVSMLTGEQFDRVNGLSNIYWGWGGEDDDLYLRLKKKGYSVENPYDSKCTFRMLPHKHETENAENVGRYALLRYTAARMAKEGFNTLRYQVLSRIPKPLYTNITVNVGYPSEDMMKFISTNYSSLRRSICSMKLPWMQ